MENMHETTKPNQLLAALRVFVEIREKHLSLKKISLKSQITNKFSRFSAFALVACFSFRIFRIRRYFIFRTKFSVYMQFIWNRPILHLKNSWEKKNETKQNVFILFWRKSASMAEPIVQFINLSAKYSLAFDMAWDTPPSAVRPDHAFTFIKIIIANDTDTFGLMLIMKSLDIFW